tara:strand:+ start:5432 stop:6619 length:1188 start_codon:yes stop_codon:yes gene_type:complete
MSNLEIPSHIDIAIIGGGMAGLSAAASLSEMGIKNVAVFEKAKIANSDGSSFGESRMYREMYSDPVLCKLAKESNKLWSEQESLCKSALRKEHGLLFYGESWEEETIEGSIPGAKKVMDEQKIPYEFLLSQEIADRFPIKPKKHFVGLFEPSAGAILSEEAINNWIQIIRENGNYIFEYSQVHEIDDKNNLLRMTGNKSVTFDQLIVASGMWTNELLFSLDLKLDIKIWPMLWAYYLVEEEFLNSYPQWFCFQKARNEDGGLYYGFPVFSRNRDNIPRIKVGIDWAPPSLIGNDHEVMGNPFMEPLKNMLDNFILNNFEGVICCDETFVSPYTMTKDVNFILDKLKPNITIFSGGSGQSFKFAPLIGKCLAEKALNKTCSFDISCWELNRALSKI